MHTRKNAGDESQFLTASGADPILQRLYYFFQCNATKFFVFSLLIIFPAHLLIRRLPESEDGGHIVLHGCLLVSNYRFEPWYVEPECFHLYRGHKNVIPFFTGVITKRKKLRIQNVRHAHIQAILHVWFVELSWCVPVIYSSANIGIILRFFNSVQVVVDLSPKFFHNATWWCVTILKSAYPLPLSFWTRPSCLAGRACQLVRSATVPGISRTYS